MRARERNCWPSERRQYVRCVSRSLRPSAATPASARPAARQQAHRQVTHKHHHPRNTSSKRDRWRRAILALLDRHSAVYLNDLLPEGRSRAQYQQLCLTVAELEEHGQIEAVYYLSRWNRPGPKVLTKPGYTVGDRGVTLLMGRERLRSK